MRKILAVLLLSAVSALGAVTNIPPYMLEQPAFMERGLYKLDSKMPLDMWAIVFNTNMHKMSSIPLEWAAAPETTIVSMGVTNGTVKALKGGAITNPVVTLTWNKPMEWVNFYYSKESTNFTNVVYVSNSSGLVPGTANSPATNRIWSTTVTNVFSNNVSYYVRSFDGVRYTSNAINFSFDHKFYVGSSSATSLNSSTIQTLETNKWYDNSVSSHFTVPVSGAEYVYVAYPKGVTDMVFVVNGLKNNAWETNTVIVTNSSRYVTNYMVWKLRDLQAGNVDLMTYSQSAGYGGTETLFVHTSAQSEAITFDGGVQIGAGSHAETGGAVGFNATTLSGGAVGFGASSDTGFAGGEGAVATNGAVQLGAGTNNVPGSIQLGWYGSIKSNNWAQLAGWIFTNLNVNGTNVVTIDANGITDASTWFTKLGIPSVVAAMPAYSLLGNMTGTTVAPGAIEVENADIASTDHALVTRDVIKAYVDRYAEKLSSETTTISTTSWTNWVPTGWTNTHMAFLKVQNNATGGITNTVVFSSSSNNAAGSLSGANVVAVKFGEVGYASIITSNNGTIYIKPSSVSNLTISVQSHRELQ